MSKKEKLQALLAEIDAGQKRRKENTTDGKCTLPAAELQALAAKAREASTMQDEVDQESADEEVVERMALKARGVAEAHTPAGRNGTQLVKGYTTLGARVVASAAYKRFLDNGKPITGVEGFFKGRSLHDTRLPLAALSAEEIKGIKDYHAVNTPLSVIGENTFDLPQRDTDVLRYEERATPNIRDVIRSVSTGASSIRFVKITAVNRGAAPVAPTDKKPYMNVEVDIVDTNVKTIAVLHKVTEQTLEDAPQVQDIVDVEMRLDLRQVEEQQIVWGDGTGENLLGLMAAANGIQAGRTVTDDTLIDKIRRAITDVRKSKLTPNAVVMDPLDWEAIELTKGDDDHYIFAVVQTLAGPRIWGLTAVESDACTNPDTNQRVVLVGDFVRSATIYDRHDVRVQVGFIDDDFGRNLRTIRGEERIAFAVKRPHGIRYIETVAAESS